MSEPAQNNWHDWDDVADLLAEYRRRFADARTLRDLRGHAESLLGCLSGASIAYARVKAERDRLRDFAQMAPSFLNSVDGHATLLAEVHGPLTDPQRASVAGIRRSVAQAKAERDRALGRRPAEQEAG